jgi:hypothetical protein
LQFRLKTTQKFTSTFKLQPISIIKTQKSSTKTIQTATLTYTLKTTQKQQATKEEGAH